MDGIEHLGVWRLFLVSLFMCLSQPSTIMLQVGNTIGYRLFTIVIFVLIITYIPSGDEPAAGEIFQLNEIAYCRGALSLRWCGSEHLSRYMGCAFITGEKHVKTTERGRSGSWF